MKPRHRLLLILLPVLAGAAVWFARPHPEPSYQGKPLSQWITEIRAGLMASPPHRDPSFTEDEAIRAMGLEALPGLLDSVRPMNYEPWWSATYRRGYFGLALALRRHLPAPARWDPSAELAFQDFVAGRGDELWPQSGPLLIKTLRHPRAEVRVTAARALGARTNRPPKVLFALTNCLQDQNGEMRGWVALAISSFGPAASNAVPAIVDNLLPANRPADFKTFDNERAWAVTALGKIGPPAVAAVPVLQAGAAQQTNAYFRVMCATALWQIRHQAPDALPALAEEFDKVSAVMPMIFTSLGEMGPEAAEVVPRILRFLDSTPNPNVFGFGAVLNRQIALEALRKIAPDAAAKWEREAEDKEP